MNFDLDDPLGDLLSEGDNDSFFEVAASKKKTPKKIPDAPKTSTPVAPKRSTKMEDLFGIGDTMQPDKLTSNRVMPPAVKPPIDSKTFDTKILKETPMKKAITPTQTRKDNNVQSAKFSPMTQKANQDDDDLSELGFDPKNPKDLKKKVNILDDLLDFGTSTHTPKKRPNTAHLSRQSTTDTDDNPVEIVQARPRTTRPITPKAPIKDPLGFFSSANDDKQAVPRKPSAVQDWLGLGESKSVPKEEPIKEVKPPTPTVKPLTDEKPSHDSLPAFPASFNVLETGIASLQQQETQLILATQMNRQESALLEMQRNQQLLIEQQEDQFNNLVQKQVRRQAALEDTIKRQQDRITAHIHLLLTQPPEHLNARVRTPPNLPTESVDKEEKVVPNQTNDADIKNAVVETAMMEAELRSEIKTLELEKVRLEDLLQNINASHAQEMSLMETSHKKQLKLLDDTFANLESRMQLESKSLEEFYSRKLQLLEDEKNQTIEAYESKIKSLLDDHEKMVLRLRTSHQDELDDIRSEQRTLLENLRQTKMIETSVMQDSNTYLQTMKSASSFLENAAGNLESIKIDLQEKAEKAHKEIEQSLEIREHRLQSQIKEMERVKQMAEEERKHLLDLVKGLETKLNDITQTSTEEQWSLRQQRNTLEVEKTAFQREKDFTREQLRREEARLKDTKDEQLAELERMRQNIEDERNSIQAEKAKIEMMERLRNVEQLQPSKTETDAAVKVAQDSARQYDQERERLVEMQSQYEAKKRALIDDEMQLRSRKAQLQDSSNTASAKERIAEELIQLARQSQQNYNNKMEQIQRTLHEVKEREGKVSLDKIQLSRERLEIQTMRKRLFQTKCSLCKISEKNQELTGILGDTNTGKQLLHFGSSDAMMGNPELDALDVNVLQEFRHEGHGLARTGLEQNLESIPNLSQTYESNLDPELLLAKFNAMRKFSENL